MGGHRAHPSESDQLNRHDFLRRLHEIYRPRTYFEIGVNTGQSLSLSRVPTVAVDPAFIVTAEVDCDLHLVRATSDTFFARTVPFDHLRGTPVDLAFIDGMHLFEFALRDFINTERFMSWTSVIVFDDVLPRTVKEAARRRHGGSWAGDVYKILPALNRSRPDLLVLPVDTRPTGTLIALCLDPGNVVLSENYDAIVRDYVVEDPQQVPVDILDRRCALNPNVVLETPFWATLRAVRDGTVSLERRDFRATVVDGLGLQAKPSIGGWCPEVRRSRAHNLLNLMPAPGGDAVRRQAARIAAAHPILREFSSRMLAQLPERYQHAIRRRLYKG
jgi:hypothetical protein